MVSIRSKLILYFIALIMLPVGTLGILGPLIYSRSIEEETTSHASQMIGQLNLNIEFYVRELERLTAMLYADDDVRRFFVTPQPGAQTRLTVLKRLSDLKSSHPEIAGILLENGSDCLLSNELYRITRDSLTGEPWYRQAILDPGRIQLIAKPIGRNVRNNYNYSADDVVSVVKAVTDGKGTPCGVIMIDLRLEVIENIFIDTTLGKSGFFFITDDSGGIVYAPVNTVIYRIPTAWLSTTGDSVIHRIGGSKYQIILQRSTYTGWKTVGVFSINELLKEVDFLRFYSFLIAAVTMVVAVMIALVFASSIARPVVKLRSLMKEVEGGNFEVRFESDRNDELSQLGRSFNVMVEEIRNLISQVYREQQMKREAELRVLQEQIKPHFLYNTLDTIQWMARENRVDDVVCIVEALTTLFRIGLSKGKELISLSDEIEHVESYLCIQKMRYEDKFDYRITIQEGLSQLYVLKLILQPLVENAIYHGVKERRGHGMITVDVVREADALVMRIADDGIGMKPERIAELEAMLSTEKQAKEGFGMFSVNERIRLSFGDGFGLRIRSEFGSGTTVEVRHPVMTEDTL